MRIHPGLALALSLASLSPAIAQIEVGGSAGAGVSLGAPDPMLKPPREGAAPPLESGLTAAQRATIAEAIGKDRPPRSTAVLVGLAVPDGAPLRNLPAAVVKIIPAYQGYKYFMTGQDLTVVEPMARQVVNVINLKPDKTRARKQEMR